MKDSKSLTRSVALYDKWTNLPEGKGKTNAKRSLVTALKKNNLKLVGTNVASINLDKEAQTQFTQELQTFEDAKDIRLKSDTSGTDIPSSTTDVPSSTTDVPSTPPVKKKTGGIVEKKIGASSPMSPPAPMTPTRIKRQNASNDERQARIKSKVKTSDEKRALAKTKRDAKRKEMLATKILDTSDTARTTDDFLTSEDMMTESKGVRLVQQPVKTLKEKKKEDRAIEVETMKKFLSPKVGQPLPSPYSSRQSTKLDPPPQFTLTHTPVDQQPSPRDLEVERINRENLDFKHGGGSIDAKHSRDDTMVTSSSSSSESDFVYEPREVKYTPNIHDIPEIRDLINGMSREFVGEDLSTEGKEMLEQLQPQLIVNINEELRHRFRPYTNLRPPRAGIVENEEKLGGSMGSAVNIAQRLANRTGNRIRGSVQDGTDRVVELITTVNTTIDTVNEALVPVKQAMEIATAVESGLSYLPNKYNPIKIIKNKLTDAKNEDVVDQKSVDVGQSGGGGGGGEPASLIGSNNPNARAQNFPTIYEGNKNNVELLQYSINAFMNDISLYGNTTGVGEDPEMDVLFGR
jgi:hypothetical protein